MNPISLADAKAHLSELVDRVEAGDSIEITRRGCSNRRAENYERENRENGSRNFVSDFGFHNFTSIVTAKKPPEWACRLANRIE